MRGKRIGVIGGGLGGLAAACTLAARGHTVALFEKSPWLGGKATVLEADGYRFDMGPTILTLPSVLRRIFAEAGRDLDDYVPMIRLDPQWRCFYDGGSRLDLHADTAKMCDELESFAPGSARGYRGFLQFAERLHDISDRFFFWRSIGSIKDMFDWRNLAKPSMLGDVLRMRLGKTVSECVRSYVPDARVAQMLDHFTQYVGSAPDASPAVLCGIAHMQTNEGIWYPRGGTAAIPRALVRLATELGVELHTGVGVRRIVLNDAGAVAGIETEAGERIDFAAVVSNADAVRTHRELLSDTKAARRFERRRSYEPACSGVVLYLGLDRRYEHLTHHNFVFSHDAHEEFDSIYRRGEPAADPTCYVCAPACSDSNAAPSGGEALYVLVHTPYLRPHHDWRRMLPDYRRVILDKLTRTAGLTDLEQHIRFESHLTPQDIQDRYNVLNGAIYGLASHGRLFGAFKPANRSTDVPGLYLAGGAAHPGPGMPMVLMSGWIAADSLDRDGDPGALAAGLRATAPHSAAAPHPTANAAGSPLLRLFRAYTRRYLARNFHGLRLSHSGKPAIPVEGPLLIVLNHPSWWDPLVGLLLSELFTDWRHFAPMESAALTRYRFLERLGFFAVDSGTPSGALTFLRRAAELLVQPRTALWITAQGRFTDPRERPLNLRAGVGHLVRRLERGTILPLALEYPFWSERCPEALAHFGEAIAIEGGRERTVEEWMDRIESGLTAAQDALAVLAQRREANAFETLIGGKSGVGGVYDWFRRWRARLRGERFDPSHQPEGSAAVLGGAS
jgi:diapolycopene oxygenase